MAKHKVTVWVAVPKIVFVEAADEDEAVEKVQDNLDVLTLVDDPRAWSWFDEKANVLTKQPYDMVAEEVED